MTLSRRSRAPRPADMYDGLAHAKPRRAEKGEQINTRGMQSPKIHPDRNEEFKRYLTRQTCAVAGMIDSATGQEHICWHPHILYYASGKPVFASDPAHSGKAYSGKLKRDDSGCMPLCRHAHDLQEDNHEKFDRRFGIDRFAIAAEHFAQFEKEEETRNG